MQIAFLIIYGGDTNADGSCGPDTRRRILRAIQWMMDHKDYYHFKIILPTGTSPKNPKAKPLKVHMVALLQELLVNKPIDFAILPTVTNAWATLNQTLAAIDMLRASVTDPVFVFLSRSDIPFIWPIWRLKSSLRVRYICTPSHRPLLNVVRHDLGATVKFIATHLRKKYFPQRKIA